jgi:hypothetical protein
MTRRVASLALLLALLGAFVVAPLAGRTNSAEAQGGGLAVPVTGSFTDAAGGEGTFVGTYEVDRFRRQGSQIVAIGTLTGTLTDSLGAVVGTVDQTVRLPLTAAAGTCDILHLELGPLDLDLLGLVVHLDRVVLDIDAQSGPGNLLGNLLCAVARLLDSGAPANAVVRLLNQILGLLG